MGLTGNGITGLFGSYLSSSDAWDLGNKSQVAWPACVAVAEGASGTMDAVHGTAYAVGCASLLTCRAC